MSHADPMHTPTRSDPRSWWSNFRLWMAVTNLTKISDNKQPVKRISADVVTRSAAIKRNSLASRSPFAPRSFPPAIEKALKRHNIPTIAQDETISGTFGWASRDFIATAYAEGIVFMGICLFGVPVAAS